MTEILVIGSDSFIARYFINKYKNIFKIQAVSRIKTDFENEYQIDDLFKIPEHLFKNKSAIVNFVAIVHRTDVKDLETYIRINRDLTLANAVKSKINGGKLFIQLSTIAVYGNLSEITEDSECNPVTHYGISKLEADKALLSLSDDNFHVAILRLPLVYGGGMAPGNMMKLIKVVNLGIPLPFKEVNNKRDFININKVIHILGNLVHRNLGGVFLVSDNNPVTTQELVLIIQKC